MIFVILLNIHPQQKFLGSMMQSLTTNLMVEPRKSTVATLVGGWLYRG